MTISIVLLLLSIIAFLVLIYCGYKCIKGIGKAAEENDIIAMQLYMGMLIIVVVILCN